MNLGDSVIVTNNSHPFFAYGECIILYNGSTLFQVKNLKQDKELPVWAWDLQVLEEPI